jgi:hypothetical protein
MTKLIVAFRNFAKGPNKTVDGGAKLNDLVVNILCKSY